MRSHALSGTGSTVVLAPAPTAGRLAGKRMAGSAPERGTGGSTWDAFAVAGFVAGVLTGVLAGGWVLAGVRVRLVRVGAGGLVGAEGGLLEGVPEAWLAAPGACAQPPASRVRATPAVSAAGRAGAVMGHHRARRGGRGQVRPGHHPYAGRSLLRAGTGHRGRLLLGAWRRRRHLRRRTSAV